MKASGESFAANKQVIDQVALSYGKFGFQNDEVIKSLTVLERGTGKVGTAIRLQGLVADIARAKNIDLAAAAQAVAKVFGGQETALRRAVPGLEKHAHGWDLIREAQKKMAGQAAAGTTESERFAATLHDTEEIVGTALLPILNKYLAALGEWLQKMNESGRLQKDMKRIVGDVTQAVNAAAGAIKAIDKVTGSFTNTLKLLFALGAAGKIRKIALELGLLRAGAAGGAAGGGGGGAGLFGGAAAGAATRGGGLGGLLGRVPELGAYLFASQARQVSLGAIGIKDGVSKIGSKYYLIQDGKVIAGPSDRDPRLPKLGPAGIVVSTSGADTPGPHNVPAAIAAMFRVAARRASAGPPVAQRNAWFDAVISRDLFRAGLQPLRQQLASMGQVAALLTKRIAITKDITRKLNLEDQLLQLNADRAAIRAQLRQQLVDQLKAQAEQARAAREAAQFRALGLDPTGGPLVPGLKALRRQLASIADAVKGTFLDTTHVRSVLKNIQRVLSGGLGVVGKDVRDKIHQILDDLRNQLQQQTGDQTKFRHVSTAAILAAAGVSLTAAERRRLRAALSIVGPGQTAPRPSHQFATAGAGITINGGVHVHGVQDTKQLEGDLTRRAQGRPHVRRGAR